MNMEQRIIIGRLIGIGILFGAITLYLLKKYGSTKIRKHLPSDHIIKVLLSLGWFLFTDIKALFFL